MGIWPPRRRRSRSGWRRVPHLLSASRAISCWQALLRAWSRTWRPNRGQSPKPAVRLRGVKASRPSLKSANRISTADELGRSRSGEPEVLVKKLTFGYLYDFRNPQQWRRPWADLYAETLDFITWTESLGFDGAWVPEHHGADDGYAPSPLVALASIAARTKTIKLGSAVALAPLYHPVRFAEECAVLDILSNGRLEMAVAVGYRRREAEAYGVDFSSRGRRTDEFLEIVRRLWAGETFSYEGRHFTLKNASIVPTPSRGRIPLFLGGFTEKALERTAKFGDGYFGNLDVCDLYLEKLRACGKDPASARI